ncbi:AraC family transcriptional regulator [Megamonas hypermegale]|uniref:AraC family transcriptional regulator n=1 Tax=Megamonas hypermegale TaxID=158847 RepID=UPI0019561B82|nr:AraC family transcriptional regulator [Megamonas hypermegale]MBM6833487.1 helix-turn-helix transcriptional regulator [Megamonas hypermegale]HJG07238.1 AraC family transcriptional regulator [Megamonas hypermegale]
MPISLPHQSIGFDFASDLSLPTLKGIGLQYVDTHNYFWDNCTRKDNICLIQYTLKGEGTIKIDNIFYTLKPNDAFLIDIPSNSQYYLPKHSSFWEFIYLEFSYECLPFMRKIYQNNGPILKINISEKLIKQLFDIYTKALHNQIKTFFENTRIAYDLWINLTEYALNLSTAKMSKIDYVKRYIDQNYYKNELTLDLIADNIGISKYYMCKEFHKKYGISPGKYLREIRISNACRLLTTNDNYTLQKIAQSVGYSNDNYFGKVFKAEKGISPAKYKKKSTKYDLIRTVYETVK